MASVTLTTVSVVPLTVPTSGLLADWVLLTVTYSVSISTLNGVVAPANGVTSATSMTVLPVPMSPVSSDVPVSTVVTSISSVLLIDRTNGVENPL